MAVYAPKAEGRVQVASLVAANAAASPPPADLTSLAVDGTPLRVQGPLAGKPGELPYLGRPDAGRGGYVPETVLRRDLYVCEDEDDYEASRASGFSMKEVFESWTKGDRNGDKWYGRDADYPREEYSIDEWLRDNASRSRAPSSWEQLRGEAPGQSWWGAGNREGYAFWYYSEGASSIVQAANAVHVSFYVSPQPLPEYDVAFKVYSSDADDDAIGFVPAYLPARDSDGRPQLACLVRSPNAANFETAQPRYHWYLDSDCRGFPAPDAVGRIVADAPALSAQVARVDMLPYRARAALSAFWKDRRLPWEDNPDLLPASLGLTDAEKARIRDGGLGWTDDAAIMGKLRQADFNTATVGFRGAGHAYIRVRREGDRLSAWTTKFTRGAFSVERAPGDFGGPEQPPSDWAAAVASKDAYLLTVDIAGVDQLTAFAGAAAERCQAGFMTYSQPLATYQIISAALPRVYVRADRGEVWRETLAGGVVRVEGVTAADYVGVGRLSYNPATGKTFYAYDGGFLKVTPSAVKANPPGTPSARLETVEIDRAVYQVGYTAKTLMLSAGSAVSVYDEMADIKSRLDAELGELNRIV